MIEYLKNYIAKYREPGSRPSDYLMGLHQELMRLDPRDFEPHVQHEVMWVRVRIKELAQNLSRPTAKDLATDLDQLLHVLDGYRGEGSHGITRSFSFLEDGELREIVERDYFELKVKLFPSGAWKSTVIMAGSVLEAILFAKLATTKWHTLALASTRRPKKGPNPIPFEEWTLFNLIDIAVDVNLLQKDPADTIHQVLRDYRNFVHPKKEIRSAHACTEAEGMLSLGALDSVCNYLEAHP